MALDAKSLAVIEFLSAVKACEDILRQLADKLRLLPQIKHAYLQGTAIPGKPYHILQADGTIEIFLGAGQLYATAVLKTHRITDWLIEVNYEVYHSETRWLIETSFNVDEDHVPNHAMRFLREFPDRYADTLDELVAQMQAAARELVENIDAIEEAIAMDAATATDKSGN